MYTFLSIVLKKSGTKNPRVELEEMGPSLDLVIRRTHVGSPELFKTATRQPKAIKVHTYYSYNTLCIVVQAKKIKNMSKDPFGSKMGQIHMTRQDMKTLKTRRVKGLKRSHDPLEDNNEQIAKKSK